MRPDLELLRAWGKGDTAAGDELVGRYFERVYVFFDGKVGNGVEDLTQRTFLACLEAHARIDERGSFRAYLFGIARKQLLQHYARVHRDDNPPPEASNAELPMVSPSHAIADREQQRLLLRALRKLPLDLQLAIELFYWEELGIDELASVLEIPGGTVKSRLFRAKQLLREHIEQLAGSPMLRESTIASFEEWAKRLRAPTEDEGSEP